MLARDSQIEAVRKENQPVAEYLHTLLLRTEAASAPLRDNSICLPNMEGQDRWRAIIMYYLLDTSILCN